MTDRLWAEGILERIIEKERAVAARNRDIIPYFSENGRFLDRSYEIDWWTNGFWAGLLWQLYGVCGEPLFRRIACSVEEKLDANLMDFMGLDHDAGFKWLPTAMLHFLREDDPASRNRALLAACHLAGRFNPAGNFIRAWNKPGDFGENRCGWAIIDCLMNLPLLYRASDMIDDPRFRQIAMRHADTAVRVFQRADGSCHHIVCFDPETGAVLDTPAGQGMAPGSAWTRGQAWALYGFTLSYLHTKKEDYLAAAKKSAAYFTAHIPESGHIPVDFDQEKDRPWEDSTAAAIAACGLLELEKITQDPAHHDAALRLLTVLSEDRCDFSPAVDPLLSHCSSAYHADAHNFTMLYADYFFTEAVLKLAGKDVFIW